MNVRLCELQGTLGNIGTEIGGVFKVLCPDGLLLLVLFSVGLVFMFKLLLVTVKT